MLLLVPETMLAVAHTHMWKILYKGKIGVSIEEAVLAVAHA